MDFIKRVNPKDINKLQLDGQTGWHSLEDIEKEKLAMCHSVDLDSWFEDREIQEFIEKSEKKSNRLTIKTKFQYQPKFDSKEFIKDSELNSDNPEEGKLPLPGGIRGDQEQFTEETLKTKITDFVKGF